MNETLTIKTNQNLDVRRMNMGRMSEMKIVEMLRLSEQGLSHRQIAVGAGCGKTTVSKVLKLCKDKRVTHAAASQMTDEALQLVLYPESPNNPDPDEPDWKAVHEERVRNKNLNLQFLWEEYRQEHPDGLSYSRFCVHYREYRKTTGRQVSLHNERKAGELMEVDMNFRGFRRKLLLDRRHSAMRG
jgi:hypothetical protein